MAHILLTYQEPDDSETREICLDADENFSGGTVKSTRNSVFEESGLTPQAVPHRRKSIFAATLTPKDPATTSPQRKLSFPAALPSNFLGLESTGASARRRFSNVSDAVTRKLSHTIGWKTNEKQSREIVVIGKSLCSQYIRSKLKRSGYLNKKCRLQRVRSALSLGGVVFREVYPELLGLGMELERLHPKVYVNVVRQASTFPGGRISSEKEAGAILTAVSRELLKNEITWGKVVSLFAVTGGLALDCVRQGHYDYLTYLVETMEDILEDELAQWIQCKGGWYSLAAMVRPPQSKRLPANISIFILSFFLITIFIVIVFSHFGISAFT